MTTASFWRPSGKNLNKSSTLGRDEDVWGVTPDKVISLTRKERDDLEEAPAQRGDHPAQGQADLRGKTGVQGQTAGIGAGVPPRPDQAGCRGAEQESGLRNTQLPPRGRGDFDLSFRAPVGASSWGDPARRETINRNSEPPGNAWRLSFSAGARRIAGRSVLEMRTRPRVLGTTEAGVVEVVFRREIDFVLKFFWCMIGCQATRGPRRAVGLTGAATAFDRPVPRGNSPCDQGIHL